MFYYVFLHIFFVTSLYTRLYVRSHIRSYVCHTYVYMYGHSYVRLHVHTFIRIHACITKEEKEIQNKYVNVFLFKKFFCKHQLYTFNIFCNEQFLTCCPYRTVLVTSRLDEDFFVNCKISMYMRSHRSEASFGATFVFRIS